MQINLKFSYSSGKFARLDYLRPRGKIIECHFNNKSRKLILVMMKIVYFFVDGENQFGSTGPVVSALCNKFGCRAVCVAGSLVAAVAFVLSTFSKSVTMMMITYGLIGGKCLLYQSIYLMKKQ